MPTPYSVFHDGNATLAAAGTPQQLASSTPCAKVIITAGENNAGNIVVGGKLIVGAISGRRGAVLLPLGSITVEIDDLSKVWFDGTNTGDTLTYSFLA